MTVTINRADGVVTVDGEGYKIDCGSLPSYVTAIYWEGDRGFIQFVPDASGRFLPNAAIVDFAPYGYLIESWRSAKDAAEEAVRKAESDAAARQNLEAEAAERIAATRAAKPFFHAAAAEKPGGVRANRTSRIKNG